MKSLRVVERIRISDLRPGDELSNGFTVQEVRPAVYETPLSVDIVFTNGVVHYGHRASGLTERIVR